MTGYFSGERHARWVAALRPARHRALAATAAFVLAALVLSSAAAAFSCVQVHPRQLLGWGIVAAEGVVESSSALGARVRVDRVYIGDVNRTITVCPGGGILFAA